MDVLADENQHPVVVARLRQAGHVVEWIRETSKGADDGDIPRRTDINRFVLVTDDHDFGDLIFHRGYPTPRSVLYERLKRTGPDAIADRPIERLAHDGLDGHIITITRDGERVKPFPSGVEDG